MTSLDNRFYSRCGVESSSSSSGTEQTQPHTTRNASEECGAQIGYETKWCWPRYEREGGLQGLRSCPLLQGALRSVSCPTSHRELSCLSAERALH